jgi:hypothetical protein
VKKRGCPTLSARKGGLFRPMPRNLKPHYDNGDLHFITISCDQKKEEENDPRFQKPKSKAWGTPTTKDRFAITRRTNDNA